MKSKAVFLNTAGGDHEAAFNALYDAYSASQTALTEAESNAEASDSNSIRTRVIAKALEPLAQALGIELPAPGKRPAQDAAQQIAAQVSEKLEGLEALEAGRDEALELLAAAGLDLEALEGADSDDARSEVVEGWLGNLDALLDTAEGATAELSAYRYATEQGLDPQALLLTKGVEKLRQVERERQENGETVKETVWVVGEGDDAPLAADHFKPVLGALKREQKPAEQGTRWVSGQESREAANAGIATQTEIITAKGQDPAYEI